MAVVGARYKAAYVELGETSAVLVECLIVELDELL